MLHCAVFARRVHALKNHQNCAFVFGIEEIVQMGKVFFMLRQKLLGAVFVDAECIVRIVGREAEWLSDGGDELRCLHAGSDCRTCSRQASGLRSAASMIVTGPGPAGDQRARNLAEVAPAKMVIRGTPRAAAACCPAES